MGMSQHGMKVHGASRRDEGGFVEEAGFIGEGERLFSCRYVPLAQPTAAALICPPICADFIANYRREVRLARALASRGVAVQRFHYRGTGNSDGDPAAMTFESQREDAARGINAFTEELGVSTVVLVGTRWGGLVAAAVSATFPPAPLVLWEPTTDAAAFFREARRVRLMRDAKEGISTHDGFESFAEEMEAVGFVDLLGYPVYPSLYHSASQWSLIGLLDQPPRPLLLVSLSRGGQASSHYETLISKLSDNGHDVRVVRSDMAESWWFHGDNANPAERPIQETVDWITARMNLGART